MNCVYKLVFNRRTGQVAVTSEATRSIGKSKTIKQTGNTNRHLKAAWCTLLLATCSSAALAIDYAASPYTPASANNNAARISTTTGTDNLNGTFSFSGSSPTIVQSSNLYNGWLNGYVTDGPNPTSRILVGLGSKAQGVTVVDAILQSSSIIDTYANTEITEMSPGGNDGFLVFSPTPAGTGPFIQAGVAAVSGGTFNLNASGTLGDNTTRNTTYVHVTGNGTANWNASNTVDFVSGRQAATPELVEDRGQDFKLSQYAGSFNVTTTAGSTLHNVTDLASLQAYNTWLVEQLQAGHLGSGAAAQAAYDAAFNQSHSTSTHSYTIHPRTATIPADDPMFTASGTRIGMLVDGANASGVVAATGGLQSTQDSADEAVLLRAINDGSITNNGTVTSYRLVAGMQAESGGRITNNGVPTKACPGQPLCLRSEPTWQAALAPGMTTTAQSTRPSGLLALNTTQTAITACL